MRRSVLLLAMLMMLIPGLARGGGGGHSGACAGFSEGDELVMEDSCFDGVAHFAEVGETVTVRNEGRIPHTVTAVDGSFDSGVLNAGETFEVTVSEPGAIRVYCTLHGTTDGDGMAGVVIAEQPRAAAAGSASLALSSPDGSGSWLPILGVVALALGVLAAVRRSRRTLSPTTKESPLAG